MIGKAFADRFKAWKDGRRREKEAVRVARIYSAIPIPAMPYERWYAEVYRPMLEREKGDIQRLFPAWNALQVHQAAVKRVEDTFKAGL